MAKALSHWRFNTLVDKSALDKRQKMFLVNNAKMEVQRSKTTLAQLYRQKHLGVNNYDTTNADSIYKGSKHVLPGTQDSDAGQIKAKVKGMCFDMLVDILKEAESSE